MWLEKSVGQERLCVTKKVCVTRKVVQLFLCRFIFLKLTAGMPRRGCLIPLIALSLDGVFRGFFAVGFSPFLLFLFSSAFRLVVFLRRHPFISFLEFLFSLSSGAVGRG